MYKITNQDYIPSQFRITITCENYRLDADIDKSKNAITAGLDFLSFRLSPKELDSLIEELQSFRSAINYKF